MNQQGRVSKHCLDSIKAKFALSVQQLKFDLGNNLVCPSLAAVSNVFRGLILPHNEV